jgi:hypothetical protein
MHDYPTGTILQSKELVGPRVVGLAGHNGTFEESLTLSGEGLVKGTRYSEWDRLLRGVSIGERVLMHSLAQPSALPCIMRLPEL